MRMVWNEKLTGEAGVNHAFMLAYTPLANTAQVMVNYVPIERGVDFELSGRLVRFLMPVMKGDKLWVSYLTADPVT